MWQYHVTQIIIQIQNYTYDKCYGRNEYDAINISNRTSFYLVSENKQKMRSKGQIGNDETKGKDRTFQAEEITKALWQDKD